jgi:hypothetical protein
MLIWDAEELNRVDELDPHYLHFLKAKIWLSPNFDIIFITLFFFGGGGHLVSQTTFFKSA